MAELSFLRDDNQKLSGWVAEREKKLSILQPQMSVAQCVLADLKVREKTLEVQAEDAKGFVCRRNVRIIGLPEGLEGSNTLTARQVGMSIHASL
ncbi:hypothetical protein NDU88_001734 [Pleurodeles waltl]|uniref:Uncharacterized protein n=1 Tax=Pleurodeles waltl TaxID=8319 RepID=A0AAV7P4Q3_PLEWA|nr:hypothetical protein NDU88_001734 [Pleurodeles waltl]